ncbi:MAG: sulfotransferase, partial [Candidatus Paceibacteria bacterium]
VLGYRHESISNEIYVEYDASHKDFETNDAFSDTPIMLMYQELDEQYEDSKFILTTRDLNSWLDSMKWMFDIGSDHFNWENTPYVYEILYEIYGTRKFEQYSLKHAWYCHHCEVYEYFQDRPDDILVVDWTSGDGWEELCSFLDKPVPSQ